MPLMTSFRRSVKADSASNKSKGWKGNFREEFRLPKDPQPPSPGVFISGEYVDPNPSKEEVVIDTTGHTKPVVKRYFKGMRHRRKYFDGGDRYTEDICSRGHDKFNPQPCAGCAAKNMGDKTVSDPQAFFAFGYFHLSFYHGHPVPTEQGWLTKKDSNEKVLNYDECIGRDCNYCRIMKGMAPIQAPKGKPFPNYNPADITTVFGRRRYIKIGSGHLSNLDGWESAVSAR